MELDWSGRDMVEELVLLDLFVVCASVLFLYTVFPFTVHTSFPGCLNQEQIHQCSTHNHLSAAIHHTKYNYRTSLEIWKRLSTHRSWSSLHFNTRSVFQSPDFLTAWLQGLSNQWCSHIYLFLGDFSSKERNEIQRDRTTLKKETAAALCALTSQGLLGGMVWLSGSPETGVGIC